MLLFKETVLHYPMQYINTRAAAQLLTSPLSDVNTPLTILGGFSLLISFFISCFFKGFLILPFRYENIPWSAPPVNLSFAGILLKYIQPISYSIPLTFKYSLVQNAIALVIGIIVLSASFLDVTSYNSLVFKISRLRMSFALISSLFLIIIKGINLKKSDYNILVIGYVLVSLSFSKVLDLLYPILIIQK